MYVFSSGTGQYSSRSLHYVCAASYLSSLLDSDVRRQCSGAVVSYVLNRIFTFKSGVHLSKSILRFILVIGICYGLSYYIGLQFSSWLLHQLPVAVRPFKKDVGILIGTGLYTLLNYTGQKYFVFNTKKKQSSTISF